MVNLDADDWSTFREFRRELTERAEDHSVLVRSELGTLGIDAAEFGRQTVMLRGVPALWSRDPAGLFRELLQDVSQQTGRTRQRFERLAASYACRSAIRSGRTLTVEEMNALVDQLFATRVPHGDPHGRPTFVQIGLGDLDRRFGRH